MNKVKKTVIIMLGLLGIVATISFVFLVVYAFNYTAQVTATALTFWIFVLAIAILIALMFSCFGVITNQLHSAEKTIESIKAWKEFEEETKLNKDKE